MKVVKVETTEQKWLGILKVISRANIQSEVKLSLLQPIVATLVEEIGVEAVDEALK